MIIIIFYQPNKLFMKISVVIPTYHKNSYKDTLNSILRQNYKDFEVLVIRNGSERNRFSHTHGGKVRIYEITKSGLDNARNFGIKHSHSDIIAFIDDDAVATSDWLSSIEKSHSKKDAPAIGGKVLPVWPKKGKPDWIKGILLAYLSILEGYSDKPIPVHPLDWLAGTNISFKKHIFKEVGYFDEELDRKEKILLSSGEVELCNRIRKKGYEIIFDPSLIVKHVIPLSRLTPQYMIDRAYWQGVSDLILDKKHLDPKILPKKFNELNSEIKYEKLKPSNIFETIDKLCKYARAIGYLQAYINTFSL